MIDIIDISPEIVREMIRKSNRLDKRAVDQYRKVEVEKNIISSAEGSARVKIGNTEIVVGVKIGTGEPFPDTQDEGVLIVSAELVPLASPEFESGPPGEEAIELARVVDRTIRESKAIDFKKLCIKEKEMVWMIYVDIDVLDYDGNFIDAACLAASAALMEARLPKLNEDNKPVYGELTDEKLPLKGIPISTTFARVGGTIIADPTLVELGAMDARLTVGTVDVDGEIYMSSMQKGGIEGFSAEEIEKILALAEQKGDELRQLARS